MSSDLPKVLSNQEHKLSNLSPPDSPLDPPPYFLPTRYGHFNHPVSALHPTPPPHPPPLLPEFRCISNHISESFPESSDGGIFTHPEQYFLEPGRFTGLNPSNYNIQENRHGFVPGGYPFLEDKVGDRLEEEDSQEEERQLLSRFAEEEDLSEYSEDDDENPTEPPTPDILGQGHGYSSGDWDSPSPILNTEPPAALPAIQPPPYSLPSSPYNLPLSKKHYWKSYHQQEKMKNKMMPGEDVLCPVKKSDREIIQDWFTNILKSWEKTNDLQVTHFKFTPMKRQDENIIRNGGIGMISQRNRSYNGRAMYNGSNNSDNNSIGSQQNDKNAANNSRNGSCNGGKNGTSNGKNGINNSNIEPKNGKNGSTNGKHRSSSRNSKHRDSNGGRNGTLPVNGGCAASNGGNHNGLILDSSVPSTSDETGNNGVSVTARARNGFGRLNGASNSSDDMSSATLHGNRRGTKSCIGNTIKEHVNGEGCRIERTDCSSSESSCGSGEWERLAILKAADIEATVKGKPKLYSVIIKVLPSDDSERYQVKHKFRQLLKFSKEVQVYMKIIKCMFIFDEKRYTSACIEPPVPKLFFAELDALNDCLVIENLEQDGFIKYEKKFPGVKMLSDLDHCRVVLRSLAHLHAYSTIIQRDSEEPLIELWPFAVEASSFQELFRDKMMTVKEQVCDYLASRPNSGVSQQMEDKIEHIIQELFWKLVELRLPPENERMTVLVHGCADLSNIHFSYDQYSGRPNQAKLTDLSSVCVSSPVVDLGYFLYSSVDPTLISTHYVALLQAYHHAHLEAIKGFGMHGYEIEFETLVQEYQKRIHYGAMWACLVRPALYIIQRVCPKTKLYKQEEKPSSDSTPDLRIDKSAIPMDIKLSAYLAKISQVCPCPCAYTAAHSVTRDIATDILQDLKNNALELVSGKSKFKGLDCNRGSKTQMKKALIQIAEAIIDEEDCENDKPEEKEKQKVKEKEKEKDKTKSQSKKEKSKEKDKEKTNSKDSKEKTNSKDSKEKTNSKDSKEKDKEKTLKESKTEKEISPKKKSVHEKDKDKSERGGGIKLEKFRYKHKTPTAPPLKQ